MAGTVDPGATRIPPPELLASAERARALSLCAECFGRLYGRWAHGLTNPDRATILERAMGGGRAPVDACSLCRGAFARLPVWVDRVVAAGDGFEWRAFSCGSRWDPEIQAREELLWSEVGSAWGESIRGAFNRELGKAVEQRTGRRADPTQPEAVFLADLPMGTVLPTVLPLYLRGRYRKHDRSIPQTRWPCRRCNGRGCDTCGGTGKTYSESVEEWIGGPFVEATHAEGTRFHGMGREDIDARMLGDGRPFVLELLRPRARTLDVPALAAEVATRSGGRVEALEVVPAAAADVIAVKEASPEKSYGVEVTGVVAEEKIKEALGLAAGRAIAQRTPTRVAHRRADRVRSRRIVAARLVAAGAAGFTLELRAEAGTYIKEWVEGDGGRTEPSLSALLGVPLRVASLDVLAIHDRGG